MTVRRWSLAFSACLLMLVLLGGYKFWQIRQMIALAESFPEPSETVELYKTTSTRWIETTATVGEVKTPQAVSLRNEVEGRIVAVGFAPGETVHKSQMLLQLDASEEIAQLRAAEADAALAEQILSRNQKLIGQKLTSQQDYDQAKAQRSVALARAESLRAVIAKKTLTAPFDARAGLHNLQTGQFLVADTVITQLVGEQSYLWVDFALPQHQADVSVGTAVSITARGVTLDPLVGTVTATDPVVSSTSRNMMFRATVGNTGAVLKPGMLVDVLVESVPAQDVTVVPNTSVLYDSKGSYVFILMPDEKGEPRAKRRDVTTGGEKNGLVVILSGLQPEEPIAGNGAYKLQDGLLAKIHPVAETKP